MMEMCVHFSNGWIVSAMIDGYRVACKYIDYTKEEAMELFEKDYGSKEIDEISNIFTRKN